jgi:hypothetical protein
VLRFYAGCCNSPVANTAPYAWMPYCGVVHTFIDAGQGEARNRTLGPVDARIFGKFGKGKLPPGTLDKGSLGLMLRTIGFILKGVVLRKNRPSVFFDDKTRQPSVAPEILPLEKRKALRRL